MCVSSTIEEETRTRSSSCSRVGGFVFQLTVLSVAAPSRCDSRLLLAGSPAFPGSCFGGRSDAMKMGDPEHIRGSPSYWKRAKGEEYVF